MSAIRSDAIEAWRGARPDLDTSPMVVVGLVKGIAAALDLSVQSIYVDAGVTATEVALMVPLRWSSGITAIRLAESLSMTRAGVSKALKAMEVRGLVLRSVDIEDRRRSTLSLTGAGCELIDDVFAKELRVHKALLASMGDDYDQVVASLGHLSQAVVPEPT